MGEKIKKGLTYIGAVIGWGGLVSLISGLYERDLPHGLGVTSLTGYGFPLSWLKKSTGAIIGPSKPTIYGFYPEILVIDVAFWSLIIGVPILLYELYKWYKSRK